MEAAAKGASFILIGTKARKLPQELQESKARDGSDFDTCSSSTPPALQEQARPIVAKHGEEAGIHYTDMKLLGVHDFKRDLGSLLLIRGLVSACRSF